jgi:hypothetical protein
LKSSNILKHSRMRNTLFGLPWRIIYEQCQEKWTACFWFRFSHVSPS